MGVEGGEVQMALLMPPMLAVLVINFSVNERRVLPLSTAWKVGLS